MRAINVTRATDLARELEAADALWSRFMGLMGRRSLPAGGYLVVAAHLSSFVTKYPAVPNVVGGWTGRLGNSYDSVELEDAQGQRVDLIDYSDQGDWARRIETVGWDWTSDADGLGRSLELRQAALEHNTGQNWESSRVADGTPGRANSAATNNLPPMILNAAHFPAIPRSTWSASPASSALMGRPPRISNSRTKWPAGSPMPFHFFRIRTTVASFSFRSTS